jgi:hypothetical protein
MVTVEGLSSVSNITTSWVTDWAWGFLLIVLTLITHVMGLVFMSHGTMVIENKVMKRRHSFARFAVLMGATAFLASLLHAIEAAMWALAYVLTGAVSNLKSAMLYSVGAMTTYGHETQTLAERWRMLGAIEALNGWLLFGLTTAFLFWIFQKILPSNADR